MEKPKVSPRRPAGDLAEPLGVTRAAVYKACHRGYIPFIFVGVKLMITPEAYDYHLENGYGPNVPPYGAEQALVT